MHTHYDNNEWELNEASVAAKTSWNRTSNWYIILGVYIPDCDDEGYYRPTQCHTSVGMCWCVDKHGVEMANSRTRGKPNCGKSVSQSA
jgi:hypothetical protein